MATVRGKCPGGREGNTQHTDVNKNLMPSGCGSLFQSLSPNRPGYLPPSFRSKPRPPSVHAINKLGSVQDNIDGITPDELRKIRQKLQPERVVCQYCHKLKNQGLKTAEPDLDVKALFDKIRLSSTSIIVLVADLTDLPWSLLENASSLIGTDKKAILVLNKVDLIPSGFSVEKLRRWLGEEGKKMGNPVWEDIILISAETGDGVVALAEAIRKARSPGFDVFIIGRPNVGKSKLLSAFSRVTGKDLSPTISLLPGTTVGTISLPLKDYGSLFSVEDDTSIIDTPGIPNISHISSFVTEADMKHVHIGKKLKPRSIELSPGKSCFLGGLVRLDMLSGQDNLQLNIYASSRISLHPCQTRGADDLYLRHSGQTSQLLFPQLAMVKRSGEQSLKEIFKFEIGKSTTLQPTFNIRQAQGYHQDLSLSGMGWIRFMNLKMPGRFRVLAPRSFGVMLRKTFFQ
ncbi:hypothetical protein HDU97_009186 [Phlyctochytrium planicorne]|nr:hypothetical protein HDU97_009186 [Phlyctochytrium planicorne]